MSLPVRLSPGQLSIYGATSVNGILGDGMQFGTIDQLSNNVPGEYSLGQSVMFPVYKSITLNYQNVPYFIVEEKDVLGVENPAT